MTCWWLTGLGWVSLLAKPTVCRISWESQLPFAQPCPRRWLNRSQRVKWMCCDLLCEGRSNQEIAATLFLSLSAIKKYSGNLYGKLGVTSRAQAIVKAHEFRLV